MSMLKRFIILLINISFSTLLTAQIDSLTFEECIEMAFKKNLDAKISQNNLRSAKLNVLRSYLALAPSVSGGAGSSFDFNRFTDQYNNVSSGTSYSVNYSLGASLTLFNGFQKLNSISAQKYLQKVDIESNNMLYTQLYLDIAYKFTNIIYLKEAIKASEIILEISKRETERVNALIDQGMTEKVALLEMRSSQSANKLKYTQLNNDLRVELIGLAQLIEYPNPDKFEVKAGSFGDKVPVVNRGNTMEIFHKAQNSYPKLRKGELLYKYAHKSLQISKGSLWPSLSLSGGCYSSYYSTAKYSDGTNIPFETQLDDYGNTYLRLSLSVPIFSAASRRINVKHNKINLQNKGLELDKKKNEVYKSIETAVKTQENFLLEYLQAEENLSFSKASFDVNLEKYQLGMITTTEFITAQRRLAEAESAHINAKYKWIIQDELLKIYSGEIIPQVQFNQK